MPRAASTIEQVLGGYAADAAGVVPAYEALSTEAVLAPVADLLPAAPCRILDVGAGTGRDAAWFARRGHAVTAAEPVAALRKAGMALHPDLQWVDDRLPGLPLLRASGWRFDLILLVGVWQHLPPGTHREGMHALSTLLAPGGRLILSVRHGPGAPGRPCFPAEVGRLCRFAEADGFRPESLREAESVQQANRDAGVTWTWLTLDAP